MLTRTQMEIVRKIKYIKITRNLLQGFVDILEQEKEKSLASNMNLEYNVVYKNEGVKQTYYNKKSFIENSLPKNLNRISMYFSEGNNTIYLSIRVNSILDSEYEVKGKDDTWVKGIASRFDEIIEDNTNHFVKVFYQVRKPVVIISGCFVLLTFINIFTRNFDSRSYSLFSHTVNIVFILFLAVLPYLVPKIEYDKLRQVTIRKIIFGFIILIIGGIFVNYIYDLLSKISM